MYSTSSSTVDDKMQYEEDPIIHLNVGGHRYCTSKSTLLRAKSTYFSRLLTESWTMKRDDYGAIFIDRDGERFRHVLNFLRSGTIHLNTLAQCKEIMEEGEYFDLSALVTAATKAAAEQRQLMQTSSPEELPSRIHTHYAHILQQALGLDQQRITPMITGQTSPTYPSPSSSYSTPDITPCNSQATGNSALYTQRNRSQGMVPASATVLFQSQSRRMVSHYPLSSSSCCDDEFRLNEEF